MIGKLNNIQKYCDFIHEPNNKNDNNMGDNSKSIFQLDSFIRIINWKKILQKKKYNQLKVLIYDDNFTLYSRHKAILENLTLNIEIARSCEDIISKLNKVDYSHLFFDIDISSVQSNQDVIRVINYLNRIRSFECKVITMTNSEDQNYLNFYLKYKFIQITKIPDTIDKLLNVIKILI